MKERSRHARDTPDREVLTNKMWHIRISRGTHHHRFVIAPLFPVPEKIRGAGC
jgi:hypothetical protein